MKRLYSTRKMLLYIMTLILVFSIMPSSYAVYNKNSQDNVDIYRVLSDVGGTLTQIQVSGWTRINEEYMSLNALQKLVEKAAIDFPHYNFNIVSSNEAGHIRQIKVRVKTGETELFITFNNGSHPYDKTSYETYLVADTVLNEAIQENEGAVRKVLQNILTDFSQNPSISTTYIAGIEGRLGISEMNKTSLEIFRKLGGKIVEGIKADGLVSKTGYTDKLEDFLITEGDKVNINVSLRYNAYDDITYIWLGTPIITIAY